MSFGSKEWQSWIIEDEEKVFEILKRAYDLGLRTYDTADVYSFGMSEVLLGKFLKKFNIPRDKVVILSKIFFPVGRVDFKSSEADSYEFMNSKGLSRKHIFDAVKASHERLGTYVDVLQIHRLDPETPKEEIMRALNDVVLDGYARYIGASSMRATEFAELQFIAAKNGWFKFVSMQNWYNLLYREEEREMIPFCQNSIFGKVGCIPYSPLARGVLTRPVEVESKSGRTLDKDLWRRVQAQSESEADREIVRRVELVAKKVGASMANVATAWVISKGFSPIIGINSVERVDDALKGIELSLSREDIEFLEAPYQPKEVVGITYKVKA